MQPVAGEPNPSVNLTRNIVPHLPGSARYAHNALPGKRVTLPHAGYLKRYAAPTASSAVLCSPFTLPWYAFANSSWPRLNRTSSAAYSSKC
jgi:hypothetical protein